MAYRRRKRRYGRYGYKQRKESNIDFKNIFIWTAILIGFVILYKLYIFVKTNWVGVLITLAIIAAVASLGIYLFFHLKAKKEKTKLEDIKNSQIVLKDEHEENKTEKTDLLIKTKNLIESFEVDIPKETKQKEHAYQISLGQFLKSNLPQHSVKYEVEIDGSRPDIVIDGNQLAIEVKAMRNTKNKRNRKYNDEHIGTIHEKRDNYTDNFGDVVFVIFNSGFVKNKNWKRYERVKKAMGDSWIEK